MLHIINTMLGDTPVVYIYIFQDYDLANFGGFLP